jgi:hypothetical protein
MYFPKELVSENTGKPSNLDYIYYLFWKRGIDFNAFNELPIPYVLLIMNCHNHELKEKEKRHKELKNKKRM